MERRNSFVKFKSLKVRHCVVTEESSFRRNLLSPPSFPIRCTHTVWN